MPRKSNILIREISIFFRDAAFQRLFKCVFGNQFEACKTGFGLKATIYCFEKIAMEIGNLREKSMYILFICRLYVTFQMVSHSYKLSMFVCVFVYKPKTNIKK